jgi:hypothetical protein
MKHLLPLLALSLAGCIPEPDTNLKLSSPKGSSKIESAARFEVERVGIFKDDLAYGSRRGIYLIRDTHTGKEFVGLSGIGISELGYHPDAADDNRHSVPDER